ncbi:MAG: UDP-N-acetylmuramoyl-tripeptide--D-alanyl-D-alanine ligase [Patescibacteria group bacterium]
MLIKNLLYIFQSEYYIVRRFLKYVYTHFYWWNLEKREKLVWTLKSKLLYLVSWFIVLIVFLFAVYKSGWFGIFSLVFIVVFLPFLILISFYLLFLPDLILKQRIIRLASKKINNKKIIKIGITGSYGKTSTKEILYKMLSNKYKVLKTPDNINTDMGVAQFILDNLKDEDILIVEMGAFKKGEIKKLCKIVQPDYSILTGINESHLDRFGSLENIIKTKFELPEMTKQISVLNFDDDNIKNKYKQFNIKTTILKSIKDAKEVKIKENFQGLSFQYENIEFETKLLARHNIVLILLCIEISKTLGIDLQDIKNSVTQIDYVPHRLQPIYNSVSKVWVIDDSYNANWASVQSGIEVLNRAEGRKIVLTPGPIVELGIKAKEIHLKVGELYVDNVDLVLLIKSKETSFVEEGLKKRGFTNYKIYNTTQEAHNDLKNVLVQGDTILFQNDWTDVYF